MEIPQKMNGWIFQITSELGSRDHALNSSRFPSRFDRAPVYHRSSEIPTSDAMKFYRVVIYSIPHYSTKAIVKPMLEQAVMTDTSSLSRKTARSHEGNVDVEPPGSMDDSSMILIEIGVDDDEDICPILTIRRGAWSSTQPR